MEKNLAHPHKDLIARIQNHTKELNEHVKSLREAEVYINNGPYNPFLNLYQWALGESFYKN